jgi:hypothetical protein
VPPHHIDTQAITPKIPRYQKTEIWLTIIAYAIPITAFLYILYLNFFSLTAEQTYRIDVGSASDTTGHFYLEPSPDISLRQALGSGNTFRELNGMTYSIFKPEIPLGTSTITATVDGAGVGIIPAVLSFDPSKTKWRYDFDFTKGKVASELNLIGDAFPFDNAMHFDGTTRLEIASSSNLFEATPFSLYVTWVPKNSYNDVQQIVGHYNWELIQNTDNVTFQIGRMTGTDGGFHSVKFPITADFFNTEHTALAIYNPAKSSNERGFIELYVDDTFAYRTYFDQEVIKLDYGQENLSLGWSPHNYEKNPHFYGNIVSLKITDYNVVPANKEVTFTITSAEELVFPLVSNTLGALTTVTLHVKPD